jgi:large subunit ribosomal protein L21
MPPGGGLLCCEQVNCREISTFLRLLTEARLNRYNFVFSVQDKFSGDVTMAFAIIQSGGKQFRVSEGEVVRVPTLVAEVGDTVNFETLTHSDGDKVLVGAPLVDGISVSGTVVEHGRGKKIIVFKMKRRKQYKKTHGHRQNYTAVKIDSLG